MNPLASLLEMRLRRMRNYLFNLRKDSAAKTLMVCTGLLNVVALGLWVSYECFEFIESFRAFGPDLSAKMITLLFFALMVLVILSTVIIAYTTIFRARETSFFFQHPIPPRVVLMVKLGEAISFSSWASLFLCLPVLVAFGLLRDAPWPYYLEATVILTVFLAFAGLVGVVIALAITPIVRRLTPRGLAASAALIVVGLGWMFLRSFDVLAMDGENNLLILDQFTSLAAMQSPFSPSRWASTAVLAACHGNHREVLFQGGILLANTVIFLPLLSLYGLRLYNRQWVTTQSPSTQRPRGLRLGRLHASLARGPVLALVSKDVLCFVRDPAQLSQSVLFVLLMVVYSLSLVQIPDYITTSARLGTFIYFANLGAVCMILSSFTSRFLFPLLSLEGRSFWILGLAPMPRRHLLREKMALGLGISLSLGLTISTVANLALNTPPYLFVSAFYIMALATVCLTALSTGLGAAYPSFDEDNPARIAVGLGGTLNFFTSALAIALLLLIEAGPYLLSGDLHPALWMRLAAHAAALGFTLAVATFALGIGGRALERSEF